MSSGGAYQILISASDDKHNKQDKILLANNFLSKQIEKLRKLKKYRIKNDIKEIIICIDKYEDEIQTEKDNGRKILMKNKINELAENLKKKKLEDDQPTIKDITSSHHLFLQSSFKPFVSIGYEYSKTVISPIPGFGSSIKLKIPKYGDFFNDMVIYVKLIDLKPLNTANKVKYCNFIGHRLFKKIKFISNNVILDEYSSEDYNFHYQFNVPEHKKNAWKKCVGQEIPVTGTLTSDPLFQDYRQQIPILNGPQTLKKEHPVVELFIPLLFWFQDPKLAIPNITLPFGQTFLEFDIASKDDVCGCANFAQDSGLFDAPKLIDFHLYTNHIYLNPDILDIFIKRIGITLIRVHKQQEMILNQSFNEVLLNEMKFPIESMYVAFRPSINLEGSERLDTWNLNSSLVKSFIPTPVMFDNTGNGDYVLGSNSIIYYQENVVVNILGLKADNISIFNETSSLFYNSYLPYQYGVHTSTPPDKSTYMFTFNFDPNSYQPSGYLNLSKIRRFYLYYESSIIGPMNTCKLIVSAKAINFLLLRDGELSLQYNV